MSPGYINDYNGCDCGSTTYGWKIQTWNFEKNKLDKGVRCGGCDKVTFEQ